MLRATKKEMWAVNLAKKHLIRPLLKQAYLKVKDVVDEKEKNGTGHGWRRTSTPEIRKFLLSCISQHRFADGDDGCPASIKMGIDVFCLIYDTDDPYAKLFNGFVRRLNKGELLLDPENKYLARGVNQDAWEDYVKRNNLEPDWFMGGGVDDKDLKIERNTFN